jgi:hypothetical protein
MMRPAAYLNEIWSKQFLEMRQSRLASRLSKSGHDAKSSENENQEKKCPIGGFSLAQELHLARKPSFSA